MEYYFFKFPPRKKVEDLTQIQYWMSGENVIGGSAVAVYFGETSTSDIRGWIEKEKVGEISKKEILEGLKEKGGGRNYSDLKSFFEACDKGQWHNTRFLVFDKSKKEILVLEPKSEVKDLDKKQLEEYREDFPERGDQKPKYVCCELVQRKKRSDAPSLIATLSSDQALNRGTCNKLNPVQKEALEIYLSRGTKKLTVSDPCELLKYLTPVQFETLVFLNFQERNFHCHAHRGSTNEGFDFMVEKTPSSPNDFLSFEKARATVEVKHKAIKGPTDADYTVALSASSKSPKILDGKWLLKKTIEQERCFAWLKKELEWTGLGDEEWGHIRRNIV